MTPPIPLRPLGHSDIAASAIALGTWAMGGWMWGGHDDEASIASIRASLDKGVTLSKAMADQEDNFPPVVRELISASQQPRDLQRNLKQAAIIIVEADNIKSEVRSVLFKPMFMFSFLMVFVLVAVQWLLPTTAAMFTSIGADAPRTTQIILAIGGWLKWVLASVLIVGFVANVSWKLFLKNNATLGRLVDEFSLRAPLLGETIRMAVAARLCDILGASLNVGMPELEALETSARACGNKAVSAWVMEHVERQRNGVVDFAAVSRTDLLPWNFRNRIETATSPTRRIEILQTLANTFHEKSQQRLTRFAAKIGPLSEGIMVGVIVGVVALIVSPILTFIPTLISSVSQ